MAGRTGTAGISIVITNYNYLGFLKSAVDSALSQTYPNTEVVVVDDGSTDGSRGLIEDYGTRVVPVFKENGGLASAVNAGCEVATGDVVCLLDADDVCAPTRAAAVAEAWRSHPDALLIYHQLQTVDASGSRMGRPWPARLLTGSIAHRLTATGGWWPRPTTSGLAFARPLLRRVLPVPTSPSVWPDAYLPVLAAFLGPVVGLNESLGSYRWHGGNSNVQLFGANSTSERSSSARRQADQYEFEFSQVKSGLASLGVKPEPFTMARNPEYLQSLRASGEPVTALKLLTTWATSPAVPVATRPRMLARCGRDLRRST